jgi:HSP20 family protein
MLMKKKDAPPARAGTARDPFAVLRQITSEFDQMFGDPLGRWPALRPRYEAGAYAPEIDVFEKEGRLFTKVDLPGIKKEDINVEIEDGHLIISGQREREVEETKQGFFRCEREYGTFYRAIPLPKGANLDDVKARFADGVLEVSVALPVKTGPPVQKITIEEGPTVQKPAA